METREITAPDGSRWEAFADEAIVAHGKAGAVLAFRPLDETMGEALKSTITFNSMPAAAFALSSIGMNELERQLALTRKAASGV